MHGAAVWRSDAAGSGSKRSFDESGGSPTKRFKQFLHDGYIQYGQEWANQAFLEGICECGALVYDSF